jgi:RNA polymerase sigma factor (sigma-70 family)
MGIKCIVLTTKQIQEFETQMRATHPMVTYWAKKAYGEPAYRRFRNDFFSGRLGVKVPKAVARHIEALRVLETPLVQHNIRLVKRIAARFYQANHHRMPGATLDDFMQEGCLGVIDCVYAYDGTTKFNTYLYWAIENRMKDYVRVDTPLSPVGPTVLAQVNNIRDYMNVHRVTFDEAAIALKLDTSQVVNCRRAAAVVHSDTKFRVNHYGEQLPLSEIAVAEDQPVADGNEILQEAMRTADLNELERLALQTYLDDGDTGYQTRLAEERGVTRAAVSAAFIRAKNKVKARLETLKETEQAA